MNPILQLSICVLGIYSSFILWGLCQERLSTTPYLSIIDGVSKNKFRSVLFLNTIQSTFSAISALAYLLITKRSSDLTWSQIVGIPEGAATGGNRKDDNFKSSNIKKGPLDTGSTTGSNTSTSLLKSYAFISVISSMASPFGFLSLSHISFPTLLLGKSCKLVPVMMMNVILYQRKFPIHKYVVVGMVTLGIWAFMAFKVSSKVAKGPATSSLLGMSLLGINLVLDGVVNSTQDEVFRRYKTIEGPQMMLFMNLFSTVITTFALLFPTSLTPSFLVPTPPPSTIGTPFNALTAVIDFILTHPTVLQDILLFSIAGAIGQLFIFLTLSLYGSLTLVTITVTRKMMTMLLSVFMFDHEMRLGQWAGVGIVFAGIGVEAEFKRRETKEKSRMKVG